MTITRDLLKRFEDKNKWRTFRFRDRFVAAYEIDGCKHLYMPEADEPYWTAPDLKLFTDWLNQVVLHMTLQGDPPESVHLC